MLLGGRLKKDQTIVATSYRWKTRSNLNCVAMGTRTDKAEIALTDAELDHVVGDGKTHTSARQTTEKPEILTITMKDIRHRLDHADG
jgi:hypothetical protein